LKTHVHTYMATVHLLIELDVNEIATTEKRAKMLAKMSASSACIVGCPSLYALVAIVTLSIFRYPSLQLVERVAEELSLRNLGPELLLDSDDETD